MLKHQDRLHPRYASIPEDVMVFVIDHRTLYQQLKARRQDLCQVVGGCDWSETYETAVDHRESDKGVSAARLCYEREGYFNRYRYKRI